jgi:glutamate-1-semialdehyde 2,1-aminomutase
LKQVKDLCVKNGAVLIFDEIITGFRWHPWGAQTHYGVTPDLSTFGKAIGNGFAVSALVGRRDIMEIGGLRHKRERVFLLSTTHGGETHELAAAKATVSIVQSEPVVPHLWKIGGMLQEGLGRLTAALKIDSFVKTLGVPCSPYQLFLNEKGEVWWELRTLFLQETIRQGVLMPYIAPSYSHTEADVERTLAASEKALKVLEQAIDKKSTEGLLVGPTAKPVFRKYN